MRINNVSKWFGVQARFLVAIMLAAVVGGASTAAVMAAIPDGDGTIHACYTTGLLARVKIIDSASQSCGSGETTINWKQDDSPLLASPAGKDLSEAVMVYWDLRNMDFNGTIFNVAKLNSSDLRGSNFSNATLTNALLLNTDFRSANLTNTNFSGATLFGANLSGLAFSGTNFSSAFLETANLSGTTFSNVNMSSAQMPNSNLSGFNFSSVALYGASFPNSNLEGITLANNQLLAGMHLESANLKNINFRSANLSASILTGADLTGSNVTGVTWNDSNYGSATCPDGTLASDHGDTCVGHL